MNTNAASPPPPRWSTSAAAMLVALASAFALSQAFRTVGAMMATPLGTHFGLSPQQLGTWAGTFHFMFGIMQLAMGVSIDMFGPSLFVVTTETVRSHVKSILHKLGVKSRKEAVAEATRLRNVDL